MSAGPTITGKKRALAKPGNAGLKETPCGLVGKWTEGMVCSRCGELEIVVPAAGEGGKPRRVKPRVCMGRCRNAICEVCYDTLNPGCILPAGPWSCSDVEGLPWESTCVPFGYVE